MKICSKCKEEKDFIEFGKCSKEKSGLKSACKACCKKYYINNREKLLNKQKNYYYENKEYILAQHKEYRKNNPGVRVHPELVFPITVTMEDGTVVTVNTQDELKALKESCD